MPRTSPSWFRWFSAEQLERVPAYFEAVAEVIDGFRFLKPLDAGTDVKSVQASIVIKGSARQFLLEELSDGQRQLLWLYLLRENLGPGDVLFLDEPDNYLSVREIQPWLLAMEQKAQATSLNAALGLERSSGP